jgi:hypothetical protein
MGRPEVLARRAVILRSSGALPADHPDCGAVTKKGGHCKLPQDYCPWHGPECGRPTRSGKPCRARAAVCAAHEDGDGGYLPW